MQISDDLACIASVLQCRGGAHFRIRPSFWIRELEGGKLRPEAGMGWKNVQGGRGWGRKKYNCPTPPHPSLPNTGTQFHLFTRQHPITIYVGCIENLVYRALRLSRPGSRHKVKKWVRREREGGKEKHNCPTPPYHEPEHSVPTLRQASI